MRFGRPRRSGGYSNQPLTLGLLAAKRGTFVGDGSAANWSIHPLDHFWEQRAARMTGQRPYRRKTAWTAPG